MRRFARLVLIIIVTLVSAVCLYEVALQLAYWRVERLTERYGPEMLSAITKEYVTSTQMLGSLNETGMEYMKVFDVNTDSAKVFVVVNYTMTAKGGYVDGYVYSNRNGIFRYLTLQGGKWIFDETKPKVIVWSEKSPEMGITWPPYH